jgi:hypothetical protein
LGLTALLAAATLTACADEPITLDTPPVSAEDLAACQAFLDDVPRRLDGEERRKVNPASALGAAWGDPAIVVRCGVGVPAEFDQFAHCEVANDVGWFVPEDVIADQDADATFTAVGFRPIVSVELPHDYRPEGGAAVIAELAAVVKDNLELVDDCE